MWREKYSYELWRQTRDRGHFAHIFRIAGMFFTDFLFVEVLTLLMMAVGLIETRAFPIWSEALFFIALGIVMAEWTWFRMKRLYEPRQGKTHSS